jgi:hypothetical protein
MTGPQQDAAEIGKNGCYFLSLLRLVGKESEALGIYQKATARGAISEGCFVEDPPAILALAAGGTWNVRHAPADYILADGEFEILRFERKGIDKMGLTVSAVHFVVGDGHGKVAWDPWINSRTVQEGKLASKRIVRRIA